MKGGVSVGASTLCIREEVWCIEVARVDSVDNDLDGECGEGGAGEGAWQYSKIILYTGHHKMKTVLRIWDNC